jgi:hypothetical protein
MALIIGTEEQIEAYFASDALGQSKLKRLLKDVASFHQEEDSSAEHFVIGSAVDCILTAEEGTFERKYYVSKLLKIAPGVAEIVSLVHARVEQDYAEYLEVVVNGNEDTSSNTSFKVFAGTLDGWETYILDAAEQTGWQPRWGADAKLKNVLKDGAEYFQDLCHSFGKTILSTTQYENVNCIVESLKTNPRTSRYFERDSFASTDKWTVYYQLPIYFEYHGVPCKALLDMVIVERDPLGNILFVLPIDFKTMSGNTFNFLHSLKQRRYDIQAGWYTIALLSYFNIEQNLIRPFHFVVESTTNIGKPLVFKLAPSVLDIGIIGKPELVALGSNGHEILSPKILGIKQLINLYLYHIENGFFLEREIQEAGLDPLEIDWEGFTIKT